MSLTNLSSALHHLALYLEDKDNPDIIDLLDKLDEQIENHERLKIQRKFEELVDNLKNGQNYNFYITRNIANKYDVCLVFDSFDYIRILTTRRVIELSLYRDLTGFILEKVDKDDVEKFLKALYIYNYISIKNQKRGEQKDLIQKESVIKSLHFKTVYNEEIDTYRDWNCVYCPSEIYTDFSDYKMDLDMYNDMSSFSDVLSNVYSDKMIGSKLKLI